jgi:peptidoglycan/LPS O-acetylase OafA/YrhL
MISVKEPKILLLAKTNLDPNSYHSILISLFRGLAALEVAAAHVRAQTMPSLRSLPDPNIWYQGLSFFTGFAHQAVLIFFVLSGWLVGGSLLGRMSEPKIMLTYCIDRLSRLWIVLIPAFLASIILGILIGRVDPTVVDHSISNEYSTRVFFGNLFGMQEFFMPGYGGNFAMWSLSYEMAYYALFPLVLMAFAAKHPILRLMSGIVAIIFSLQLATAVLLYFAIWMLGVIFSRIRIDVDDMSRSMILAIFVAVAVYFRLTGKNDLFTEDAFVQDLILGFILALVLSSRQSVADMRVRRVRVFKKVGLFLSQFSFTLYVIHVPILLYLKHLNESLFGIHKLSPDNPMHYVIYFSMLSVIVLCSYCFYLLFEAQTVRLRQFIKGWILERPSRFSKISPPPGKDHERVGPTVCEPGGEGPRVRITPSGPIESGSMCNPEKSS